MPTARQRDHPFKPSEDYARQMAGDECVQECERVFTRDLKVVAAHCSSLTSRAVMMRSFGPKASTRNDTHQLPLRRLMTALICI